MKKLVFLFTVAICATSLMAGVRDVNVICKIVQPLERSSEMVINQITPKQAFKSNILPLNQPLLVLNKEILITENNNMYRCNNVRINIEAIIYLDSKDVDIYISDKQSNYTAIGTIKGSKGTVIVSLVSKDNYFVRATCKVED